MNDFYSKSALTVIALALLVIAAQQAVGPSRAAFDCGGSSKSPCYVKVIELECGGGLMVCPVRIEK